MKNKKNRLAQASHYGCVAGIYLATERGFGFVALDENDEQGDIFIPPHADRDAWHGDHVLIRMRTGIAEDGSPRREGEVVRMLARSREEIVGRVRARGKSLRWSRQAKSIREIMIPKAHLQARSRATKSRCA